MLCLLCLEVEGDQTCKQCECGKGGVICLVKCLNGYFQHCYTLLTGFIDLSTTITDN